MVQTAKPSYINDANSVHTGFVQVQLQLHRSLHLQVQIVLVEAATERLGGLVQSSSAGSTFAPIAAPAASARTVSATAHSTVRIVPPNPPT